MKYPGILLFRLPKYDYIDIFIQNNKEHLICNIKTIYEPKGLNSMFDSNYPILVTFGDLNDYLPIVKIPARFHKRWLHYDKIFEVTTFNQHVNYCYMHNVLNLKNNIPSFSVFTTCYKSYDKIKRAYNSLLEQTFLDWEWVILDDSPEDEHFVFLRSLLLNDARIRLYKRATNSGNIGNVKNEVVSLCRGKYVLELDHDDEVMPTAIEQMYNAFETDSDVGFVYMNFANVYENGNNFSYGDYYSLGYAGYYLEKVKGKWIYVSCCANINNVTLSNIVSIPNHPRCWRREFLASIGNYSELLPISDDYELFLRTFISKTKIIKINELGYIQYMNEGNNNFSLIRNGEINRLCKEYIYPFSSNKINDISVELNCNEKYEPSQIWKRGDDYVHKYRNKVFGSENQIVYIGFETLLQEIQVGTFERKTGVEYILLDNNVPKNVLQNIADAYKFDYFKIYSMTDCTEEQLIKYFKLLMTNDNGIYKIITRETYNVKPQKTIKLGDHETTPKFKITIITPSIRPENLLKIKETIKFDYVYKWIIVYDQNKIAETPFLFKDDDKIIELMCYSEKSISGNAQRNYALDRLADDETYIYFLDDDTGLTNDIYKLFDILESEKVYTFGQKRDGNIFPYINVLKGDIPEPYLIDTAQMLISSKLINILRWIEDRYNSDGYFIRNCIKYNKDAWIFVDEVLAGYNSL